MRRLASLLTVTAALLGATALAPAQRAAAQEDLGITIELDELTPRVVTADGPAVLTVAGQVRNDGDRTIQAMSVRVQRGDPVTDVGTLQGAIDGATATDAVRPKFVEVPGALGPGASVTFRVDVPLRGGGPLDSLGITEPGVYPVLVNLNGQPDFGGRARVAAVRLLLPVLGLPAQDAEPPVPATVPPQPSPLTLVWPIVDKPQRLPTGVDDPVVLADDSLAQSLRPGGRLHDLVRTATTAAPPGSAVAGAMCVAIDPDLVQTVALMAASGYQLPDGAPGSGRQAAVDWLASLRQLVDGRCVLALPMADVDLVALARAGLTDLMGRARSDGAQIVRDTLGVEPVTDVVWPAGELIDERTLTDLASLGTNAVLVQPRGVAEQDAVAEQAIVSLTTGAPATASLRGVLVDTVVPAALAGPAPGSTPPPGSPGRPVGVPPSTTAAGTGQPLAAQDGIAALTLRAMTRPSGVTLVPPRRWDIAPVEAAELLRAASLLIATGVAAPRSLLSEVGRLEGTPDVAASLAYPVQTSATEIPPAVIAEVARLRDQLRDLTSATARDPRIQYDPAQLLDPMSFGLLRGMSTAWRGDQGAAEHVVQQSASRLTALRESVMIVPPGGPYLLGASDAPLVLNIENPLPVQIAVQVSLSRVPGLETSEVDVITIPAGVRRQVRVPAEVERAGQFSVTAALTTPGGTSLGPRGENRIQLRSTAYGTVTLAITGGAAVALVLLSAYRITRRVRAARAGGASTGDSS